LADSSPDHHNDAIDCDALSLTKGEQFPPILYTFLTMETYLTAEEILELVTTGMCKLSDDLMIRMAPKVTESYEDSDWYNDPNCVMSRHHY